MHINQILIKKSYQEVKSLSTPKHIKNTYASGCFSVDLLNAKKCHLSVWFMNDIIAYHFCFFCIFRA